MGKVKHDRGTRNNKGIATNIEIDGPAHERKASKDEWRERFLLDTLGIFTYRIRNQDFDSHDIYNPTVKAALQGMKAGHLACPRYPVIEKLKLKIHMVNIATWFPSLSECDDLLRCTFDEDLRLEDGLELIREHKKCPKALKQSKNQEPEHANES